MVLGEFIYTGDGKWRNEYVYDRRVFWNFWDQRRDEVAANFKVLVHKRRFHAKFNRFVNFRFQECKQWVTRDFSITNESGMNRNKVKIRLDRGSLMLNKMVIED